MATIKQWPFIAPSPELAAARKAAYDAFDPLWKARMEREGVTKSQARQAERNEIVDAQVRQIAVVLPSNCTMKLAREMAAYAAQQANHAEQRKQLAAPAKGESQ